MKNLKSTKGITLVALIITIIVLLILAMISIRLVMNGGIIDRAERGTKAYSEAEIGEQIKLAYAEWQTAQWDKTAGDAKDFVKASLEKTYGENTVESVTETNGVFTVKFKDGREYTYNVASGTTEKVGKWIDNGNASYTFSTTGQTIQVGDTVFYNSGVAAYEGTGDNQGKWGILGIEDGKLLIMSKENVATVQLSGKRDWLTDGTTKLNNACTPFKNETYADSARSVKVEDINKITGYTPAAPVTYTYTITAIGVKRNDNSATSTKNFEDINGTVLVRGDTIEIIADAYYYSLTTYLMSGTKVYNLLNDNSSYYWLNSSSIGSGTHAVNWGFREMFNGGVNLNNSMWNSAEGAGSYSRGVRAVVSLKSNLKLSGNSSDGWTIQ